MDLYLFTLALSFGALLLMSLLGFSQHHTHGGHSFKFHKVPGGHSHHPVDLRPGAGALWLGLLSPRTFFSVLLGFGATGLILRPLLLDKPALLFALAAIGGWGFESFLVQPLWKLLFGFASAPAQTLDTLAQREEGFAATDFDAAGHGLIAVHLDGQVRQVLGTLPPDERGPDAPRVRTGDRLFIRAVNRRRNTCTVSRVAVVSC